MWTLRQRKVRSLFRAEVTCSDVDALLSRATAIVGRCGVMIEPTPLGMGEGFSWLEEVQTFSRSG